MADLPTHTRLGFSADEWDLLLALPQAVLTAASAAESDSPRRTRAERAAGLEAVAAGREFTSRLVTALAEELTSRLGDPETGAELPVVEPDDPEAMISDVLDRARVVAILLANKVDAGEADAYRQWVISIADEVIAAAPSDGLLGFDGSMESSRERRFREDLARRLTE